MIAKPYENPVGGDPEKVRENRRQSTRLLKEAGYEVRDQKLVDKNGKQVSVEFLVSNPPSERIVLFYKPSLERLGMEITVRTVDDAQYQNRLRNFDYDIITDVWGQSLSPGNEQRDFWGSETADVPGSRNSIGIKNPVVDKLIDKIIFAADRETLVGATRALDRVLLWHYYVVPQFTYGFSRYARWDRFSHAPLPQVWPVRSADVVVVRQGQGRQDRQAFLTGLSRRRVLVLGGSAMAAAWTQPVLAAGEGIDAAPESQRHVGVRRSEISGGFFQLRLCKCRRAQGRRVFDDTLVALLQHLVPDLQFAQQLHSQGRRRLGNGPDVCVIDGPRRRRARCDVRPCRALGEDFPGQADLSLCLTARSKISRRHKTDRAGCGVLPEYPEGEGAIRSSSSRLRDMTGAEANDDATLAVTFAAKRGRDVPLYVAGLPIFSKAYYDKKPFDESTMDIPLGSGPYKVGRLESGRYIEYDRVKDWWAKDLPVSRGAFNFDAVRYEFYRDRDVAFEGFTGRNYLYREEFTARIWNTRYDFPAIKDGRVKQEILPDDTPSGAQGWFLNTRREQFKDPRVREALIQAFDFEWTNKTIMYGAYARTQSPFQNSDLMANGPPSPEELKLLEPFRGQVPDEVFGAPFVPPGLRRLGPGPRAAAQGLATAARCGIPDQGRQAPPAERRSVQDRIFAR